MGNVTIYVIEQVKFYKEGSIMKKSIFIIVALLIIMLALVGCGEKLDDFVLGEWTITDSGALDGYTIYFNEGGTMGMKDWGGQEFIGSGNYVTYTVDGEKIITYDSEGNQTDSFKRYEVDDSMLEGSSLMLKR